MSCNSYAFDTECTKETGSMFLLFLLCLSLAYQVLSLLLLIYWSPIAVSGKKSEIHTVISTVVKKLNKINVVAYAGFLVSFKMARFYVFYNGIFYGLVGE